MRGEARLAVALGGVKRLLLDPEPPLVAVEVRARALGVVRLAREAGRVSLAAAAALELPEGALRLSMSEPNLADPGAFRRTLQALLERAGVLGGARIGLVLPDPVARVALLPASEAAGRGGDAEDLIRFRLRKAVPFDVREARVASRPAGASGGDGQVLAVAILRPVLEEYEAACRGADLEPGLVELAGLVLLDAVEAGRAPCDRVIVNWDDDYVSIVLTRDGEPVLFRTLAGASAPDQVVREAANTVLYYRERLGGSGLVEAVVRSAAIPATEAATLLTEPLGLVPQVMDPWGPLARTDAALPGQALAGAAACLLARGA